MLARMRWIISLVAVLTPACDGPLSAAGHESLTDPGVVAAPAGAFPWVVSLRAGGSHACTGSAIAPDLILTAYHCVDREGLPITEALWGVLDRSSGGGRIFAVGPISSAYVFDKDDVVVLRVDGELDGGELVPGVGIPGPYARLPYHFGQQSPALAEGSPEGGFESAGWGLSTILLTRDFDATPPLSMLLECPGEFGPDIPVRGFCLPAKLGGELLSNGDSGGPLTTHPVETGERLLLGVVSASENNTVGQYFDIWGDVFGYYDDGVNPPTIQNSFWYYLREPQAPQRSGSWTQVSSCSPALSDARGYTDPSWYETIQTADVDGDGDQDFLARESTGLFWFERQPTGFVEHSDVLPLSDGYGFHYPTYYESIRAADFDGDGRADLMAMHKGWALTVYRSAATSPDAYAPIPDSIMEEFATLGVNARFSAVDVTGDGRIDIVGASLPLLEFPGVGTAQFVVAENASEGPEDISFLVYQDEMDAGPVEPISGKFFTFADVVFPSPGIHPYGAGREMLLNGLGTAMNDGFVQVFGWHDHEFVRLISGAPDGPPDPYSGISLPLECDYSTFHDAAESQFTNTFRTGQFFGPAYCEGFIIRCPDGLRTYEPGCGHAYWAGIVERAISSPAPLRVTQPYLHDASVRIPDGWDRDTSSRTVQVGDVNGDGFDDFVTRSPSGMLTYLNDATGRFQPAAAYDPPLTDVAGWDDLSRAVTLRLVRMNATDSADTLVGRDACGISTFQFTP